MSAAGFGFEVASATQTGAGKQANEDCAFCAGAQLEDGSQAVVLAVADGVGGLQGGHIASAAVIAGIETWWRQTALWPLLQQGDVARALGLHVQALNDELYRHGQEAGFQMGTTLTTLVLWRGGYHTFHVGDSRAYRITQGFAASCHQLTQDQVAKVPREKDGKIVYKTVLTDCIGNKPTFSFLASKGVVTAKESYLVCSDGVYKRLKNEQIARIVRKNKGAAQAAGRALVAAAQAGGETDDITAVVAKVYK